MILLVGRTLLALSAAQAPQATLAEARVRVVVLDHVARVTARYVITDPVDSTRFNGIRLRSQRLEFERRLEPRFRLDSLPGLLRVTAPARGRVLMVELRYSVSGNLARIPLFVPETPTRPGESRLDIVVDGVPAERAARFGFPGFTRESAQTLMSAPNHLPSFLAVVGSPGAVPVPAIAQWTVALLALGALGAWLFAQRKTRHAA